MELELLHKIDMSNGFWIEQAITKLAVKFLFDGSFGFNEMRRTIILPEKQK